MMNEFDNAKIDLEQLLRDKSWNQLSGAERSEVMSFVSGEEEYDQLYAMMHQLKASSGVHEEDMKPSATVRRNLLEAFDAEKKKRKAGWWFRMNSFLNETIRFDIPAVRFAVASVILIAGIFVTIRLINNDAPANEIANQPVKTPAQNKPVPQIAPPENTVPEQPQLNPQPANPVQPQNLVQNDNVVPNNNGAQIVETPLPAVVDTNAANRLAYNPDSIPFITPLVVVPGVTNSLCCGTSNGTIVATPAGGVTFSWTNGGTNLTTGTITVNGLPPRSRSLANDAEVLDVMFALK